MSEPTGPEWRGEPLAYGTIVYAPRRHLIAMVLTGKEGALVDGWHRLLPGEHALLVIAYHAGVGDRMWMLDFESESIRWHVAS